MATGHSLEVTRSRCRAVPRRQAVVFNPGSSPFTMSHALLCGMGGCYSKPSTIYTTGRDPISLSSYAFDRVTDRVVRVRPKRDGDALSHSLSHFLPPKPLPVPQRSAKPHRPFVISFPNFVLQEWWVRDTLLFGHCTFVGHWPAAVVSVASPAVPSADRTVPPGWNRLASFASDWHCTDSPVADLQWMQVNSRVVQCILSRRLLCLFLLQLPPVRCNLGLALLLVLLDFLLFCRSQW